MEPHIENKLQLAVDRYVDGLDVSALIQIVTDDMWMYYSKGAALDEVLEFIAEMEVTVEETTQ